MAKYVSIISLAQSRIADSFKELDTPVILQTLDGMKLMIISFQLEAKINA
jgi:hypothetical protein